MAPSGTSIRPPGSTFPRMDLDGDRAAAVMEDLWRKMIAGAPERFWRRLGCGVVAFVSEIPAPSMNGVYVFRNDIDVPEVRSLLIEVSQANVPFCLASSAHRCVARWPVLWMNWAWTPTRTCP